MAGANGYPAGSRQTADAGIDAAARLFAGPGEMRARCRALDWAATPLGPVDGWPQSLRTAVALCLASGFPMLVMWGPALVQVYNDAFRSVLQAKHPAGLGQRARDCWPELWAMIGPMYQGVLETGESIFLEDQLFTPEGRGEPGVSEEAYFTFSYSAIPDDALRPAGILATTVETTRHVRARGEREAALEAANRRLTDREARYRALFEALDAGFCVIEVLFDAAGRATDYRFLETNPAFVGQTGLADAVGRTARELVPGLEAHWFEVYGGVARTGEPARFENGSEAMGRWFDVYAFRVDRPEDRRVAIFFYDVTAAKAAERERARLFAASEQARAEAERTARQLQDQAVELELQAEELQATAAQLEERTGEAEAARRLAEAERARATAILETTADAYFALDAEFRITAVNAAMERGSGLPRAALLGRVFWDVFPGAVGTAFERHYRAAATQGVAAHFAHDYSDGRLDLVVEVDAFPARPGEGGVVVFWRDITARVRAERDRTRLLAEVAAERERLRSVVLHSPAPLALLDGPEHRYALVNDAFRRISGGGRDVTGLTPQEAFPEAAGSGLWELLDQVYATGEPWIGPETLVRYDRDGTGVMDTWFDLRYDPVRDAEGRTVAVLNYAVEVTEQVRARRRVEGLLADSERARAEAEAARRDADAANRAKGEFLAVMSHELRTPLNAIGGYAELIELGIHGPVTEAQRAALARIQASQRHLLGLIAGVLDYSRVEAGAVVYRLADVSVAEAVAEAEALVAPQLRAKGLGYAWSGAPPGLRVRADREKLQQILLNLLGNAIKFTDARGGAPGRVEVSCATDDRAEGPRASPPGCVAIRVRDTGAGIDPELLERVFEPFVQADQRLTRPNAGVGLGLAISRDLARGMGGDLTVESTVGAGSTFTLVLPRGGTHG